MPFDLDISRDGKLVSLSLAGPDEARSGMQVMQLRVMPTERLLAGDATPTHQFELGTAVPEGFVFSDDGRYLYGSSYYTGVSNIYRYDLDTSKLEALSNAETGYFRPLPLDESNLLIFHYTAEGFVPASIAIQPTEDLSAITFLGEQIATRYPAVQGWGAGPPSQVDYRSQVIEEGAYKPYRQFRREALYPVIEGYKDSVAFGAHARFSDPIGFDSLHLTLSYSPDSSLDSDERLHANLEFKHLLWSVGLKWYAGNFYDLFGPKKRSREGYSLHYDSERPLVYAPPETLYLVTNLAFFDKLDALPGFQNVPSPTDKLTEGPDRLRPQVPALVDRQGRRRDWLPVVGLPARLRGRGQRHPERPRHLRLRLAAADPALVAVGTNGTRRRHRRDRRSTFQRLFRRLPQQLRRQRRTQALSRAAQHAGLRDRRA